MSHHIKSPLFAAMGRLGASPRLRRRIQAAGVAMAGILVWAALAGCASSPGVSRPATGASAVAQPERIYTVRGVVRSLKADGSGAVLQHEEIPGYMDAMTMPFRVRHPDTLKGIGVGDKVTFQFHVGAEESWMDEVRVLARASAPAVPAEASAPAVTATNSVGRKSHPLMDYKFTNQLGRAVSLSDFRGQALAITFIFTRCPVPDYCPRLTRNFQETALKLSRVSGGPTNWHLLSFTIDPAFDTPPVLKSYAERYQYDPARWSFLTGPTEQVTALVRESGVTVTPEAGLFSHNFRTLIINPNGELQTTIPIGGPISDGIVVEMLRAMGVTNR